MRFLVFLVNSFTHRNKYIIYVKTNSYHTINDSSGNDDTYCHKPPCLDAFNSFTYWLSFR